MFQKSDFTAPANKFIFRDSLIERNKEQNLFHVKQVKFSIFEFSTLVDKLWKTF